MFDRASHATERASGAFGRDQDGEWDVFVHDRQSGLTERASESSAGSEANGQSGYPSISGDGRFVAFVSKATNLATNDTNGVEDIFLWDRSTRRTELISVALSGLPADRMSQKPSVNRDGRYVLFESPASNLVSNDSGTSFDVFLRDRAEPAAQFTLKPRLLDFGEQMVGTSTAQNFWLRNKGLAPLPLSSMELRGPNRALYSVRSKCGAVVDPGSGCAITVTFSPTSIGKKYATLKLIAGESTVRTRELVGTAVR